jgi:hypothetical protein
VQLFHLLVSAYNHVVVRSETTAHGVGLDFQFQRPHKWLRFFAELDAGWQIDRCILVRNFNSFDEGNLAIRIRNGECSASGRACVNRNVHGLASGNFNRIASVSTARNFVVRIQCRNTPFFTYRT